MEDIQGKYEKLLNEYNTLRIENEELKSIPQQHGIYNPQIEMFARFKMKSSFHKTKRII